MNPDESFVNRFEIYELQNYILAKQCRSLLEEEFKELEQEMYEDAPMVKVCYDYEKGQVFFGSGGNLEDYVINMIEQKDFYRSRIKRLKAQEELFDLAVNTLTPRERDVIQVHYFNKKNDLGLSLEFFNEILLEAQTKLCSFIGDERKKQREVTDKEQKQQRKIAVDEWKRGREVS